MANDLAVEIVAQAWELFHPRCKVYRIQYRGDGNPTSADGEYFDELHIANGIVKHLYIDIPDGFENNHTLCDNYARMSKVPAHKTLISNNVRVSMLLALQTARNARWAIEVKGIRIFEFVITSTKHHDLQSQDDFRRALEIIAAYT